MLRSQSKGLAAENAKLAALAKKIPTTADLPALLRQLAAAATTSDVDLISLTPQPPVALTAAPGVSAISLAIGVRGTYFNVEQYLNSLESLDRGLLVSGVTAAPASDPTEVGASPELTASIAGLVFTGSLTGASATTTSTTTG
jgi:Tfp pilus assembly protein PilO